MRKKLTVETMRAGRKRKQSIEDIRAIAHARSGKCLSKEYIGANEKLQWECQEGHQWWNTPAHIKAGQWCPECAGTIPLKLEDLADIAKARGGELLSKEYKNSKAKLKWRCEKGHVWQANASRIRQGRWCHVCAGWVKGTIEDMRELAKSHGGQCLSKKYNNAGRKLTWQCSEGHKWSATPNKVQQGGWCPECSAGIGERITRAFFKQLFRHSFPKSRPKWLQGLELDGFSPELKLAFEHQGQYHYGTDRRLSKKQVAEVQQRDQLKKRLCELHGIKIIEVPEIPSMLPIKDVKKFIKHACNRSEVVLPEWFDSIQVELKEAYSPDKLEWLRYLSAQFGGELVSTSYLGNKIKYTWRCSMGHVFDALVGNVRKGQWCPECAGNKRLDISTLQELAFSNGGALLSKRYIRNREKLKWQCSCGNTWWARVRDIRRGSWCPVCGIKKRSESQRLGIEMMREIAVSKKGECLSEEYINKEIKLKWRCKNGHVWMAAPGKIRQGRWCPTCAIEERAKKRRLSIDEMRLIALSHGGKCLSRKYTNARTKLMWQCRLGHIWEAPPDKIKQGRWCPECRKKNMPNSFTRTA